MKKVLHYLAHPAHYHNVKHVMRALDEVGIESIIIARDKEVLFDLLKEEAHRKIYKESGRKGKFSLFKAIVQMIARDLRLIRLCIKERPSVMVGSDIAIAHVGWLLRIPSLLLNENDAETIPFVIKYGNPFATLLSMPSNCSTGGFDHKTSFYNGCHELAYLSPKYFKISDVSDSVRLPYVLIRLVSHNAHHDLGIGGISDDQLRRLVSILSEQYSIYLSSEREVPADLNAEVLQIDPSLVHHYIGNASLFIGDSATMVAEGGVLGVHSIYFSDFAKRLCNINRLEEFGLASSFLANEFNELLEYLETLDFDGLPKRMADNKESMLQASDDVTVHWLNLVLSLISRSDS